MSNIKIGLTLGSGGASKPNGNPSGLSLIILSATSIKCNWTNGATNQDGTYVYTSLDGVTNWILAGTALGNLTTKTLTGLVQNTTYYIRVAHYKGSKLSSYSDIVSDWTYPDFAYTPVVEDRARVANKAYSFTGSTRTVGSGKTYSTISAAYAAASSNDIIEVYDSLDMNNESGGYLLLNTAAKRILIRGMGETPSDVVLSQGGSSSFCVRKLATLEVVFENIKITTSKNAPAVYNDTDADNSIIVFNSCYLENTGGANGQCYNYIDSFPTRNRWVEFKNCTIYKSGGAANAIGFTGIGSNYTVLVTNSTVTNIGYSCFRISGASFTGGVCFYDSTFNTSANVTNFHFGTDGTTFTQTITGILDIRGCQLNYNAGAYGHHVLFGGDTSKLYFVNNRCNSNAINQVSNLGLVIKTVSASIEDAIIKGNRITSPYPVFFKGCANIDVQYNKLINLLNAPAGVKYTNTDEAVDGIINNVVFKHNDVYSPDDEFNFETAGLTDIKTCIKTGELDYNTYCTNTGKYINKDSSDTEWDDKATFWGNDFDLHSKFKSGVPSPV